MKKQLTTLAVAALLGAPGMAGAEINMPSGNEATAGKMAGDSPNTTAQTDRGDTIKAEIVEIDGQRVITKMENGEQLVFQVEGSAGQLKVGDELELKVDDQAKTGVILNVFPQDKERKS